MRSSSEHKIGDRKERTVCQDTAKSLFRLSVSFMQ